VAAYNAGENVVLANRGVPPYPETRRYVDRVLKLFGGKRPFVPVPSGARAPAGRAAPQPIHSYTDAAGVVHFTDGEAPKPEVSPAMPADHPR